MDKYITESIKYRGEWDIPNSVDLDKKPDCKKPKGLSLSVGIQSLYNPI